MSKLHMLLKQFASPITLILIGAALLSLFLGDRTNASSILAIVVASSMLGCWQERGAANALAKLLAVVQTKTTMLRDGNEVKVALAEVVSGDLVLLAAEAAKHCSTGGCMWHEQAADQYLNARGWQRFNYYMGVARYEGTSYQHPANQLHSAYTVQNIDRAKRLAHRDHVLQLYGHHVTAR